MKREMWAHEVAEGCQALRTWIGGIGADGFRGRSQRARIIRNIPILASDRWRASGDWSWFSFFGVAAIWSRAFHVCPYLAGESYLSKDDIVNVYKAKFSSSLGFRVPEEVLNAVRSFGMDCFERVLGSLPAGSFALRLDFTLRKPYVSRDDTEPYVADNVLPVRKDYTFKVPCVSPSQWKGTLRAAMAGQLSDWWLQLGAPAPEGEDEFIRRRLALRRLFGDEPEVEADDREFEAFLDDVGGRALASRYREALAGSPGGGRRRGRLQIYPTFFGQMGLEIINPHDRVSGAGSVPVYVECVPQGTNGQFAAVYLPFDAVGDDQASIRRDSGTDLLAVAEGLKRLLLHDGIGGKTSNGYGLAEPKACGSLAVSGAGDPLSFVSLDDMCTKAREMAARLGVRPDGSAG